MKEAETEGSYINGQPELQKGGPVSFKKDKSYKKLYNYRSEHHGPGPFILLTVSWISGYMGQK